MTTEDVSLITQIFAPFVVYCDLTAVTPSSGTINILRFLTGAACINVIDVCVWRGGIGAIVSAIKNLVLQIFEHIHCAWDFDK